MPELGISSSACVNMKQQELAGRKVDCVEHGDRDNSTSTSSKLSLKSGDIRAGSQLIAAWETNGLESILS
jgi:hypothetical protein